MDKRKRNIRQNHFLQLLLVIVGIVIINLVSNIYYDRYDLTSEKRYTLSEATKEVLTELDDIVFFRVFPYIVPSSYCSCMNRLMIKHPVFTKKSSHNLPNGNSVSITIECT